MDKPANLYEAFEQVCEAIAAQPNNYYQAAWARPAKTVARNLGRDPDSACGTAYCRAGWLEAIIEDKAINDECLIADSAARRLLKAGIPSYAIDDLFDGNACGNSTGYGTPPYIAKGIQGVKAFMAKYEEQLKGATLD